VLGEEGSAFPVAFVLLKLSLLEEQETPLAAVADGI
jgi:hypothetical protein